MYSTKLALILFASYMQRNKIWMFRFRKQLKCFYMQFFTFKIEIKKSGSSFEGFFLLAEHYLYFLNLIK